MKNSLSPRDWQDLSAYLDHQLNPRQIEKLEQRLNSETELREALQDLSRIQAALRSQPTLRAPRNFTLSAEMVGKQTPGRAYPALRLAAVLASLLFVVLLVGDLLGTGRPAAPAQPAMLMQAEMAQSVETEASPEAMEAAPAAAKMAPQPYPLPEEQPMSAMSAPSEEATLSSQETLRQAETEATLALQAQDFSLEEQAEQADLEQADLREAEQEVPRMIGLEQVWLRSAEIVLALIAILAGIGAWYLHRRTN